MKKLTQLVLVACMCIMCLMFTACNQNQTTDPETMDLASFFEKMEEVKNYEVMLTTTVGGLSGENLNISFLQVDKNKYFTHTTYSSHNPEGDDIISDVSFYEYIDNKVYIYYYQNRYWRKLNFTESINDVFLIGDIDGEITLTLFDTENYQADESEPNRYTATDISIMGASFNIIAVINNNNASFTLTSSYDESLSLSIVFSNIGGTSVTLPQVAPENDYTQE